MGALAKRCAALADLVAPMQNKRAKKSSTRPPNAEELRFLQWCKEQPSIVSGEWGVEVHHCAGSSAKTTVGAERVQIGHFYCIPLTPDEHKMFHTRKREFINIYDNQWVLWERLVSDYPHEIPEIIKRGVAQYGR